MSKYVFILGAGASVHAGAPLMFNFLDRARDLFLADGRCAYASDLNRVFNAMSQLQVVHSKSVLDIVNLESVLSAFEMATLLGVEPGSQELLASINRLIAWTLNESTEMEVKDYKPVPARHYSRFAELIETLSTNITEIGSCCIITFNYDLALDFALKQRKVRYDYVLRDDSPPDTFPPVPLLKLHGSVNWGRCPKCERITAGVFRNPNEAWVGERTYKFPMFEHMGVRCCDEWVKEGCVIVPPTWNKSEYRSGIDHVWRRAAAELQTASTIVVCGYSLPESDSFFRYLYGLGTAGRTLLERFWVFDPSPDVRGRFQSLLGPGAQARFEFRPRSFEDAVGDLHATLPKGLALPG
jgi:hypothetical protein